MNYVNLCNFIRFVSTFLIFLFHTHVYR